MENRFNAIATGKKMDIVFQCVMFTVMIVAILYNEKSLLSFLFIPIMGLVPLLSSIVWLVSLPFSRVAMGEDGLWMRILIILLSGVLIGLGFAGSDSFISALAYWIAITPIIGIAYCVITCKEYVHCTKAAKSDYSNINHCK